MTTATGFLFVALFLMQDRPPSGQDRGVDWRTGVNIHDLTVFVQRRTGKRFLFTEELGLRNKKVYFISEKPLDDPKDLFTVYQNILQVTGFILVPTGEGDQETFKIKPIAVGPKEATKIQKDLTAPEDRFVSKLWSLNYVSPRDVHAALINMVTQPNGILQIESAGLIMITDYDYNIQRFDEIIKFMDIKKADVEFKMIALKNSLATDVDQMLNNLAQTLISRSPAGRVPGAVPGLPGQQEQVRIVSDRRTNSILILAEPGRMQQLVDLVTRLDAEAPYETGRIYIYHLKNTDSKEVAETLTKLYTGQSSSRSGAPGAPGAPPGAPPAAAPGSSPVTLPGSTPSALQQPPVIVPDSKTNSILIVTDRNTWAALRDLVNRLDQRRPQVLIKASVVEVTTTEDFDFGVELARIVDPKDKITSFLSTRFGMSSVTFDAQTGLPTITPSLTPGISLGIIKDRFGNVAALATALEGKGRINTLAEPETVVVDNSSAKIEISQKIPFVLNTLTGTLTQPSIQYAEAKTTLEISPNISDANYIRLKTSVQVERFIGASQPNLPPPSRSRKVETAAVHVPNGSTLVIGGVQTDEDSKSEQGVPYLSNIPIFGYLFKRTRGDGQRVTLYIFITPYIIYDYGFGDYEDLSQSRIQTLEKMRGHALSFDVGARQDPLPISTFRFVGPVEGRRE